MSVNHSAKSGGIIGISFSIFFNMKVYCVFSLESPQRGDSNDYTQYTISQYEKRENHPKLSQICSYGICSKEPMNEFETAVVNEPPLKFHCQGKQLCHFHNCLPLKWGSTPKGTHYSNKSKFCLLRVDPLSSVDPDKQCRSR